MRRPRARGSGLTEGLSGRGRAAGILAEVWCSDTRLLAKGHPGPSLVPKPSALSTAVCGAGAGYTRYPVGFRSFLSLTSQAGGGQGFHCQVKPPSWTLMRHQWPHQWLGRRKACILTLEPPFGAGPGLLPGAPRLWPDPLSELGLASAETRR